MSAPAPSARASASLPHDEQTREVRAEQIRLIYTHAPFALTATLVNAPIVSAIQWKVISPAVVLAWLTYMLGVTVGRFVLMRQYRRASPAADEIHRWRTRYVTGVALAGCGWGSTGIFLFPEASVAHQVFLAFVPAGMTAGAVTALSSVMKAYQLFAVPALLPLAIRFFAHGDTLSIAMGGMTLLFTVLTAFIARSMHAAILTSLNLRFENKQAMANIKTLRGLLPICAHCKKIRDGTGYWRNVEAYVSEHTEADFSHGICPECLRKLYPDFSQGLG